MQRKLQNLLTLLRVKSFKQSSSFFVFEHSEKAHLLHKWLVKNRNSNKPYNEDWEYKPVGGPDVDEAEKVEEYLGSNSDR